MLPRLNLLATLAAAGVVFLAPTARGDQAPHEVYTVTASQADAMGYRGWTPDDDSPVVLYAKSELVSYTDLDLSKPADVVILIDRLDAAAQKACREIGWKHAVSAPRTRACAVEAKERALVKLQRQMDAKGMGQLASTD